MGFERREDAGTARIELISPTTQSCEICSLRRSIQSQPKNLVFHSTEYLSFSVVNGTFLCYLPRSAQMVSAMKKAGVLAILFIVILLAVGVIAEAQQPKKIPRIGYLSGGDPAT